VRIDDTPAVIFETMHYPKLHRGDSQGWRGPGQRRGADEKRLRRKKRCRDNDFVRRRHLSRSPQDLHFQLLRSRHQALQETETLIDMNSEVSERKM